jgi:predicted ATPase/DNA-binding XRE family transcriptional regulator
METLQPPSGRRPSFGALLLHYRLAAGLTQEELAERAGLSVRNLRALERGAPQRPQRATIGRLAAALTVPTAEHAAFVDAARRRDEVTPGQAAFTTVTAPPFVGRAHEIALLEEQFTGQGPPVLVLAGEPGIGKSRLLQAAAARALGHGLRVLAGGCQRQGGQTPYTPLLEALQRHLKELRPAELRQVLQGCAWLVRLLPELTVGPIEPLPAWTLPPEQERRLMFAAVARCLANVAAGVSATAGVLLVLDDLQWAGSDTLDLLMALARSASELPLRMVCAYRDTDVRALDPLAILLADLAHAGLVRHHAVRPLDDRDARQLLVELVEEPQRESPAARTAVRRTGGVPFYLVSYAHEMRLQRTGPVPADDMPWNVAHSIRQRVAALPAPAREILGVASVVGRVAPRVLLSAVVARLDLDVLTALDAAGQARLLVEEGPYAYQFAHDVVREVVEADLGAARRGMLHRLVAEILEARAESSPVAQLAYHYARSDQPDRALPYLARAAEQAREVAAHQEEAALLAQAIELARQVGRDDLLSDLHARRGKAVFHLTLMAEARREMQAALASQSLQRPERQAEILIDMALASYWHSDAASTRRYGSEALSLAERIGREDLEIAALGALVFADSSDGEHRVGLDRYRQAALRAGVRYPAAVAPGIQMASAMLYWLADFDNAIRCATEAIALSRTTHDTSTLAQAQGNLGCALMGSGRYAEAFQVFTEVQRASAEQGAVNWLARSTAMRGGLHLDLYDFAIAEELAEEARELSRSVGWMNALASAGIDLLLNLIRRGEIGRAEGLLTEVTAHVAQGRGTHGWLWRLRFVQARAELAQARDEHEHALRWADEAIARSRKHGRVKYEVAGRQVRAQTLVSLGRQREAIADLRSAVEQARSAGDPAMFMRAAGALLAIDGTDELLAEARAAVERIAAALPDEMMRRRFRDADVVRGLG